MKKLYITLLSSTALCWSTIFAQDAVAELQDDINKQLTTANQLVTTHLNTLKSQLGQRLDGAPGLAYGYCKTDDVDCGDDANTNTTEKQDVIISKVVGGWVGSGHSSNQGPMQNFLLADGEAIFNKHLCLEVLFKNSSEIKFAKPFYMGKTVVLCAEAADGSGLINIDNVDVETNDGGSTVQVHIADGKAGWRCFNPDEDLGNGDQAFGYDSDGSRILENIDGILNNCITNKSTNLTVN